MNKMITDTFYLCVIELMYIAMQNHLFMIDYHNQSEFYDELSQILHCKNTVSTMLKTISMMAFPPKAVDG